MPQLSTRRALRLAGDFMRLLGYSEARAVEAVTALECGDCRPVQLALL